MGGRARVLAVVLLAVASLALPYAAAQPWARCPRASGNYSAGSAYETSLLQMITDLQSNASQTSPPALFASGSGGAGAGAGDVVYGLLLCRADIGSSDCFDCCTIARQDVQRVCNRTRDVALCYNQCYVRLSATDFLASANNSGLVYLYNVNNVSDTVDVAAYSRAVTLLLNATVRSAVQAAASPRLFATGQLEGLDPSIPNMWSAAQCVPDLSPALCQRCLDDLVADPWWNVFNPNKVGARIAGSRCNLRCELGNKFYTGDPTVTLQANGEVAVPVPVPVPAAPVTNTSVGKLLGIILPIVSVAVLVAAITVYMWNARKKKRYQRTEVSQAQGHDDLESIKSTLLSLSSLQVATNDFDESNKLGEGGFGAVYKGDLSGQQVAVKRLSKGSSQGLEELRNELVLVAKLYHKNLVRLVGFCLEEGEKLLVYEYMPNKSLDTILFDPEEKRRLDWRKRFHIIEGVARGLQYLHEDSQKKIVHRDLKASNVLLDADMNPKIGDFGLARLFGQDQTRDVTNRIVGTFGYMSPEYVMRGQYSTKSDVFSFGILVIEIVTGRRNSGQYFYEQHEDVISI